MNTETIATVAGGNNDKEEQCWTLLGLDRHEMDVKVMENYGHFASRGFQSKTYAELWGKAGSGQRWESSINTHRTLDTY